MQKEFGIEIITPEMAEAYLENANPNRKPSDIVIERYTRDMESGEWELNGETIKFNGNGGLVDGKHRLLACVRSRKSFRTYVVRNVQEYKEIDIGRKRSVADAISIFANHTSPIAALAIQGAIGSLISYAFQSRAVDSGISYDRCISHQFMVEFAIHDFHFKNISGEYDEYLPLKGNPLRPSVAISLLWLASVGEKDFSSIHAFLHGVRDGLNLSAGDPALVYRNYMIASSRRRRMVSAREAFRVAVGAVANHLAGNKIQMVKATGLRIFPGASPDRVKEIIGLK